ncbi:MAG TPA: thiamine diphosphokinase [Euzebyales bacterium]|nr:thiamine diphosphokinase [Euzebyales bacterium]
MRPDGVTTVAVIAGGQAVSPAIAGRIGDVDYVIAADSGLHAVERLGLTADLVVGDLDSVDPALLDRPGLEVDRHPAAKDRTDIVLALDRALDLGAGAAVVVSGGDGRLDHAFANLLVLASPRYARVRVRALIGDAEVEVVRDHHAMSAPAGTVVSLFAVDGPARGVTTEGLRYPLRDEVLDPLSSRGVSNEFAGGPAAVRVAHGVLLVIRPGGERRDTCGDGQRTP